MVLFIKRLLERVYEGCRQQDILTVESEGCLFAVSNKREIMLVKMSVLRRYKWFTDIICHLSDVTVTRTFSSIMPFLEHPAKSSSPTPAPCTRNTLSILLTRWMSSISTPNALSLPSVGEGGRMSCSGNDFDAIPNPPNLFLFEAKSWGERFKGKSSSQASGARIPTNAPTSLRTSTRSCLPIRNWINSACPFYKLQLLAAGVQRIPELREF